MPRVLALARVMVLVLLVGGGSTVAAPDGPTVLRDGVPVEVRMPPGRRAWTARVDVLPDATWLHVIASGDRDVDLFLRHGRPPNGDPAKTSDVAAVGDSPHEIVTLSKTGKVRLRPGPWYVTIVNPAPKEGGVQLEVAVFIDRKDGRRTLLPGAPVAVTVPEPGHAFAMRTWLPRRTIGSMVDWTPEVLEGLRYRLKGPGGFQLGDTTQSRIVMRGEDTPRGVYTLSLSAPAPSVRPPRLTARVTWSFKGGFILPRPASPLLEPGTSLPVLMGGPSNGSVQPLRIAVDGGGRGFVLDARTTSGVNVDLYVRRGLVPHRRDEDAEWLGLSVGQKEKVVVAGHDALARGIYHAEVLLVDDDKPVEVVVTQRPLAEDEALYTWGVQEPSVLLPDEWLAGSVHVYESALTWHAVDVPAGTTTLHAQLLDATGPLELVLASGADGRIIARSFTPLVGEHLEATFASPLPNNRRYLIGVLNRATWDEEVTYRLAVGIGRRPPLPPDMPWPPGLSIDRLTPAERTAAATVEITIGDCSGGSGVCVSPDGLVLSCRHCLKLDRGFGGVQKDGIIIAFPQELEAPPIQAYYAKILDESVDRDLVLLAPLNDVFDRPLPDDVRLPWLPLGDSSTLRLGQPLWVGGYPQVGSECTRTAVILSRGIVAGLERRKGGPAWIKTDAWVAPGHSGGPLVDAQGRLMGIAAATLGNTESLGLGIPIGRLPPEWLDLIEKHLEPVEEATGPVRVDDGSHDE